jgi:hypothetical protein
MRTNTCSCGAPPADVAPARGETLHHCDEDKTNNRIGNLELLTRGAHNALHNAERGRDGSGRFLGKVAS